MEERGKRKKNLLEKHSRKELRRQKRLKLKQNRRTFFSNKKFGYEQHTISYALANTEDSSTNVNDTEIDSRFDLSVCSENKPNKIDRVQSDRIVQKQLKEKRQERELKRKMKRNYIEQLKKANIEEDKTIRRLEKRLRIAKHKNDTSIHKMFNDGLDYALELCLPDNLEKMHKMAKNVMEVDISDDDVGYETKMNKSYKNGQAESTKQLAEKQLYYSCENDFDIKNSDNTDSQWQRKRIPDYNEENVFNCSESATNGTGFLDDIAAENRIREDIYRGEHDENGGIVKSGTTKYIPPHAREHLKTSDTRKKEKLDLLHRYCKGLLNRLSEANINKIAGDVEDVYNKNSRFDVNCTLMKLTSEAIIRNALAPKRMVLEYAMLVAVLHVNIGCEVGAHFLENLIAKIDKYFKNIQSLDVENKELDNTLFLLAHMYTFKIFQHSLIYDILDRLSDKLCEKSVDCLLLILRSIGFQLRKDNPLALKHFILNFQKKANTAPVRIKENPRLKFMIEILLAIKNNNISKVPQYDPSLAEHLKKIFKTFLINGKYITSLNITMEDILSADRKGKWWVIGSAWTGNVHDTKMNKKNEKLDAQKFSSQLLMLARQQRMNTEDKKNVFCVVMSAEDYMNAFEKLSHLCIKDQRVIVSVIIHCCLSERTFNPYYGALAKKFCDYDRKYQLATQYALWDRMKEIQSAPSQEIKNLAQFIIYMIRKGGQSLSVLKVIQFEEMDRVTLRFCRQIMSDILLGSEEDCSRIFGRITHSTKLDGFKCSLRLFMHHFLLKLPCHNYNQEQIKIMKIRVKIVDELLQTKDSKVIF